MNIVFDFGGVVFRWQPLELLRSALPRRAPDAAAARGVAAQLFDGYPAAGEWATFDRGEVDARTVAQRIARRTTLAEAEVLAFIDAAPRHLEPIAGTVALIERLALAGHKLFYLSNMPAPFADHLRRSHAVLARFADGVFSSQVHLLKPQREIFDLAARRFGLAPGELVFIDDVAYNVEAAVALGWRAIEFRGAGDCEAALGALAAG